MMIRFAPWDDRPQFAVWKKDVQVAVEADDFAHNVLWAQWSRGGADFWRRASHGLHREVELPGDPLRISWEQGRAGTMAQVGKPMAGTRSKDVLTCVSLNVDTLNGVAVLFYCATSVLVDHDAVREFIQEAFPNARGRHHDASNFHNAVKDIREIYRERSR
jgi:hypothetical protein